MSRRLLLALPILLAAVAPPATAVADPPWSAPAAIPGAAGYPTPVVFTPFGHGAALTPADPNATKASSELTPLGADGTISTPQRLTTLAAGLIATYGADRIVVAGSRVDQPGIVPVDTRPLVAFGTPAGVGAPRTLPGTSTQRVGALAANARGDVALVTLGSTGSARDRLVWLRARSGAFRLVLRTRVSSQARDATVAVGPKGDLLFVYEDHHEISARHRGPSGRWGPVRRLGPGVQSQLQAAVDGSGRLTAAWVSERVSEGDTTGPAVVSFITAPAGHGFGTRRTLETVTLAGTGHYVSAPGVRLVVDGTSHAALAWTGAEGANFVTRYADVEAGHVAAPVRVSPSGQDAVLGDLAATEDGAAVVAWRLGVAGADPVPGATPRVYASPRAVGERVFGPPEAVSNPADNVASPPFAAIDPVTHRAVVAFGTLVPGAVDVASRPPLMP